jgi:hypothetical protein
MATSLPNCRWAQTTIASSSIVSVERIETGAVVVRVALPPKTFQKMVMGGAIGAAIVSAMDRLQQRSKKPLLGMAHHRRQTRVS